MQNALFRYLSSVPSEAISSLALLLVVTTILAYQPAWHGGFIWDDDAYITNNELLTAPDGLRRIWFSLDSPSQVLSARLHHVSLLNVPGGDLIRPVTMSSIFCFIIANALLLWGLLARLRVPGAWLAGAIFALHPVQVESVAWITERKNVLMGLFFLLTIRAWVEFVDEQTKHRWFFTFWHWCFMPWPFSVKRLPALPSRAALNLVVAGTADQPTPAVAACSPSSFSRSAWVY